MKRAFVPRTLFMVCCKCGFKRPIEDMAKNKNRVGGVDTVCKFCVNDKAIIYYHTVKQDESKRRIFK